MPKEVLKCSQCDRPALPLPSMKEPLCPEHFTLRHPPRSLPDLHDHFRLTCGRKVRLDALTIRRTYADHLVGYPTEDRNRDVIEGRIEAARRHWGDRKVHVIPPRLNKIDPEYPELPPVCFAASLSCYETHDEEHDGSTLMVIWFGDDFASRPLQEVVYEEIKTLPWDELAEGFSW